MDIDYTSQVQVNMADYEDADLFIVGYFHQYLFCTECRETETRRVQVSKYQMRLLVKLRRDERDYKCEETKLQDEARLYSKI